jgi:hypothetical protein
VSVEEDATFSPLRAQATPVMNVDDVRLAFTMFEARIVHSLPHHCSAK